MKNERQTKDLSQFMHVWQNEIKKKSCHQLKYYKLIPTFMQTKTVPVLKLP